MDDLDGLSDFAQKNNCFTVIGPEAPLAAGIVDKFNQRNLKVFGPSKLAAQLESSKIWAKNFTLVRTRRILKVWSIQVIKWSVRVIG